MAAHPSVPALLPDGGRVVGEGLLLRRATSADTEPLITFHGSGYETYDDPAVEEDVKTWVRDLTSGKHPTTGIGDFLLVEDTRTKAIVSSICLISQTWSYCGVPFGVGRVELVGTLPDYRRRGLVKRQFEAIHALSAAFGELLQIINGVPWFYRQFGYEYAVPFVAEHRGASTQRADAGGAEERYRVRRAGMQDLPFIARLYESGRQR